MPTHYEILGAAPGANPEELRQAYLRRARALHPDHLSGASDELASSSARAMQDVNEAWRVLRDPASRSSYDRSIARPRPAPQVEAEDAVVDPDDRPYPPVMVDPAHVGAQVLRGLPWVAVVAVLAAIFVFTAFAGGQDGSGDSVTRWAGKCVGTRTGVGMVEVPCSEPGAELVSLVVERQSLCPNGSTAAPVEDSWLCLRRADGPGAP
ncbi:MAG: J domain-containing protein [Acidimicrobiia bacterium]|nr:J domain-containing protein [Acidimicrobiia bacterium]